jgi:hypothetical protein
MTTNREIHFRADDELLSMIEFLVSNEQTEAMLEGRTPRNKTQIIKKAIQDYYVRYTDKTAANAFSDSIQFTLTNALDDYFNKSNAMFTGKLRLLQDFIKEINLKELLMLKVLMHSASAEKYPNKVQEALEQEMTFEKIIAKKAKEIMGGNE